MYLTRPRGWLSYWDYILVDIVCLLVSCILAYAWRFDSFYLIGDDIYWKMFLLLVGLDVLMILLFDLFREVERRGYYQELAQTIKHAIGLALFFILILFAGQDSAVFSRIMVTMSFIFYTLLSYIFRVIWKHLFHPRLIDSSEDKTSLYVVAPHDRVQEILRLLKRVKKLASVKGLIIIDRDLQGEHLFGIPVVANKDNYCQCLQTEWIDEVVVDDLKDEDVVREMLDAFGKMGIVIHLRLAKKYDVPGQKQMVEQLDNQIFLTTSLNYITTKQALIKRTIDIIGGICGCILTGILYMILAPKIKKESRGPVFFKQQRMGKNGKIFELYKFRSMYLDAEERLKDLKERNQLDTDLMFKLENDPRIIGSKFDENGRMVEKGIGNFIRDWSLDEFPQFINVLKGDMSLVGTRPPTIDEWDRYELHHRARLAAKPGITGLWQVSGRSSIKDFEEVVRLDTQYIENWSIGLDLRILLKTVKVVLKRDGSM